MRAIKWGRGKYIFEMENKILFSFELKPFSEIYKLDRGVLGKYLQYNKKLLG